MEGKTESSTEPAPLNPNFATVHRRVAGPTMRRPVTPPRRRPRAEQPAPGPGHYEPAPSEAPGAKASAWSRAAARAVAAPAGASGSAAKPAGATAYDVERGLALVRPAAPAIGFGPRSTQRPSRGASLPTCAPLRIQASSARRIQNWAFCFHEFVFIMIRRALFTRSRAHIVMRPSYVSYVSGNTPIITRQ